MAKGKILKASREQLVGQPFNSTRLASLGAFRAGVIDRDQLMKDDKLVKAQNKGNHGSALLGRGAAARWADDELEVVDDEHVPDSWEDGVAVLQGEVDTNKYIEPILAGPRAVDMSSPLEASFPAGLNSTPFEVCAAIGGTVELETKVINNEAYISQLEEIYWLHQSRECNFALDV